MRQRVLLRVWDWWAPSGSEKYGRYFAELEREYERRRPGVDVLFQFVPFAQYEQKMATGLTGATPPDVFQASVYWAEGFYDRGMLLPLNGFLERERRERQAARRVGRHVDTTQIVDAEAYLEAAWRHNTKPDGTVFGVPHILDANALTWNLDLLREEGHRPEIRRMFRRDEQGQIDWKRLRWDAVDDWEHFRTVVRALTRRRAGEGTGPVDDPEQAGFVLHAHGSGAGPLLPWLAANGSSFQDDAGTTAQFADEAGVEAMQFVLDLYWKDRVCPPFRRQMSDDETFATGKVACAVAGTYSGKYIVRNTEGRLRFDQTAFPPGPRGTGHTTLTWGNMLVVSRRSPHPEIAWDFVKFVAGLDGQLRLLRTIDQNSPRKDFYESPEWRRRCEEAPYLWNVDEIAASGRKLRHTQINAVDNAIQPIFESILLRYPEILAGRGPYPSVAAGMRRAADAVDRVYARYREQASFWAARRELR